MKKYRLIKECPFTELRKGTIVIQYNDNESFWYNSKSFHQSNVTNYPEFWELVEDKEFEILSISKEIISVFFEKTIDIFCELRENNRYISKKSGDWADLNMVKTNKNYKIHSIKRLSDNEVFNIGDKCYYETNQGKSDIFKIESFTLKDNHIYINGNLCELKDLIKAPQKLFTTLDGIDIFKNDRFYLVDTYRKTFDLKELIAPAYSNYERYPIRFHSKESAIDYIVENKPCLSYEDLRQIFYKNLDRTILYKEILDLIKQKLNLNK